jgi:hypothetical protein
MDISGIVPTNRLIGVTVLNYPKAAEKKSSMDVFSSSHLAIHFTSVTRSALGWLTDSKEVDVSTVKGRKGVSSQSMDLPYVAVV